MGPPDWRRHTIAFLGEVLGRCFLILLFRAGLALGPHVALSIPSLRSANVSQVAGWSVITRDAFAVLLVVYVVSWVTGWSFMAGTSRFLTVTTFLAGMAL
jgi:hypothetical protein